MNKSVLNFGPVPSDLITGVANLKGRYCYCQTHWHYSIALSQT